MVNCIGSTGKRTVTYLPDFLKTLQHLIRIDAHGIYNVVCKDPLRYPKLLDVYKKYDPNFQYTVTSMENLKLMRTNLVLSTKKLEKSGFKVRKCQTIMEECIKNYVKYS